jgi:hypothetical protein
MSDRTPSPNKQGPRSLRIWLALLLGVASVSIIGATASPSSRSASAGASTPCASDGNGGCQIVLPCPAGQTTNCPTVDVQPNTNLADGQYVYLTATNFDPTGSIRVAFCSAVGSTTDPTCLNGVWETQALTPTTVPVTNEPSTANLTSLSYPVFYDPAGEGNSLIPAHDLTNKQGTEPSFNCDDASNPCELVVTAETGQGNVVGNGPDVTAANSAVIPLTFAAQSSGCPSIDPQLQVESSFSLEHFIPSAVEASCANKGGVIALNTVNDDATVVKDFAAGTTTVAFVDNASDASQLAALLGKSYAYVPIALSGTTESFLAGESNEGQNFPINQYDLTPNMVAGLLTSLYQSPDGTTSPPPKPKFLLTDNLMAALAGAKPAVTCADLTGCPSTKGGAKQVAYETRYNAFSLLNPVPAGDYAPQTFGSFNSNVASGSSYQATQWLCSAPNTPFQVQVAENGHADPVPVTVTDTNVGSTTLTTVPLGSSIWPPYPGATWIFPQCQGYSTLPALSATATNFGSDQAPELQAKAMRSWCYGGGVLPDPSSPQNPCAAFGLMDTSEARFLGLSTASLENAAGKFVAPTTSSLEAAAGDFTACPSADLSCPAGTFAVNYGDTNAAAYPLANITYAIVPTSTFSNAEGTAVKSLLTNLVDYSHSSAVPAGYAPLPDSIYQAALADIATDVSIAPASPTTTTTTTTSPGSTTTTIGTGADNGSGGGTSDYSSSGTDSGYSGTSSSALPLTSSPDSGSAGSGGPGSSPVASPPASIPPGSLLVALAATTRYLLPAIVLLALGSLVGGLLLLFGPGAAARRRKSEGGTS